MEFDPIVYDKSNYDTLLPAKRLVEVINKMKINNKYVFAETHRFQTFLNSYF
jgi:hypothetical protein